MNNSYIIAPFVEMREDKPPQSKVVSQALFSENIQILQENGEWSYIATPDGYTGWIPKNAITTRQIPYHPTHSISRLRAHLYQINDIEYGPMLTLPYGSRLLILEEIDSRWIKGALPNSQECYIQKGDVLPEEPCKTKNDLVLLSQKFLGLPYTWGGRSSFGYDCSGFVQMLYGKLGIHLQRDARLQILDSRFQTCDSAELDPGDLIFFGKAEDRIMHVALSLGNQQFIHATSRENMPWLRISSLTDFEWSGHPKAHYPYRTGRKLNI